jgi:hypothetical protein
MSGREVQAVEPFVERIGPFTDSASVSAYRFGYRIKRTKDVLSTVDIPAETVERALTSGLSLTARMSPTGDVSPALAGSDAIAMAPSVVWAVEPIERLVADAVNEENLCLEEAGTAELRTLLARLEHSVMLVTTALAQIGKSNDQRDNHTETLNR